MSKILNVLIVDDSASVREMLKAMVNSAPDMRAVGPAKDGVEAVQMARDLRPDVILMDIIMPRMDGLEATREIMYDIPTPIVLVTASLELHETGTAFRAMSLGALAVHRKPVGPAHADYPTQSALLLNKLRLMADVQVIRHRNKGRVAPPPAPPAPAAAAEVTPPAPVEFAPLSEPVELIALVASTGGPGALTTIIQQLPPDFTIPVVIVQHISPDFVDSLRSWMARSTLLPVAVARPGDSPQKGTIYLAPGGKHLRLTRGHRFAIDESTSTTFYVPSGDILLRSVGEAYGNHAIGVILTGIGDDGAQGLKVMMDAGAFTIAQDEATSVVFGMPKAAAAIGAARQVLPLPEIAPVLIRLAEVK